VLKNWLFGESVSVFITRSYAFFDKSIETTILTNQKKFQMLKLEIVFLMNFEVISNNLILGSGFLAKCSFLEDLKKNSHWGDEKFISN